MNKDTLLKSVLPEEDVMLEGKGAVRVRSLTRAELHQCTTSKGGKKDPNSAREAEFRAVSFGMLDPILNITEVREWAKVASAGEFQKVVKTIMRLSSVGDDDEEVSEAQREAYDDFRE